jgi:predicted nucleic acid-binding protein
VASLVDTNILVYCFDSRELAKRAQARELLRRGAAERTIQIPHQALIEFVSVVTRRKGYGNPLLPEEEAIRQAEGFMADFPGALPQRTRLSHGTARYGDVPAAMV